MKLSRAYVLWLGLAIGIFSLVYFSNQANFPLTIGIFSLSFLFYLMIYFCRKDLPLKHWEYIALVTFLIPLFSNPTLSPDYYRFLWDGEMATLGIHPYAYTPNEIIKQGLVTKNGYLHELYTNITELSKQHYSPYPTVNQLYFIIPAWLTESILPALIIMRLLVLGTLLLGYRFMKKIVEETDVPMLNIVLLILNPFFIIEVMDNLHFEGVMMAWLVIGLFYFLKRRWVAGSFFWGVAVAVKLTPLILLPAFLRFFKLKRTMLLYVLITFFSTGLTMIMLWPVYASNVFRSIRLYFNNFEFNASVLEIVKWCVEPFTEFSPTPIAGPITVVIGTIAIVLIALWKPINSYKELLSRFMWLYVVYLIFATTVHPWYIILPFVFSVFSTNKGVLAWSFLIMLSYGFYHWESKWVSQLLIVSEYILLSICLIFGNQIDHKLKQMTKWFSA